MLSTIKALTDVANFAKNCEGTRIEKRIWTNPSPTSDFGDNIITCDLSNATEAKIVAQFYPKGGVGDVQSGNVVELTIPISYSGDIKMFSHTGTIEQESVYIWTRRFKVTASNVEFGNCILRLAANPTYSSIQPKYCVPLYINAVNYLSLGGGQLINLLTHFRREVVVC